MRARVQSEEFGEINLMHGSYLQDWLLNPKATSWRVDPKTGGPSRAFGDIGSHWCDLVEWVTGDRIARLVATTSITIKQRPASTAATMSAVESDAPLVDVQTEDSALIMFRTANDIAGSAVISQLSAGRKNRLWIEVDGMHPAQPSIKNWPSSCGSATSGERGCWYATPTTARPSSDGCPRCQVILRATPNASRTMSPTPTPQRRPTRAGKVPEGLPTFADGARAAEICDAMLRSAASGEWVSVG